MVAIALAMAAIGCTPALPGVSGAAAVAPSPGARWTPPAHALPPAPPISPSDTALPPDIATRVAQLTLTDILALGLARSPATQISWAQAKAAAAAYGVARSPFFPQLDASATGTQVLTAASAGRVAVEQFVFNPQLSLNWLLLDAGGRAGAAGAARNALLQADFTHNATLQGRALTIATAYFTYVASRSLLASQRATLTQAKTSLEAAEERRRVGVATIADVLQARTAFSQAELAVLQTEGDLATARGALAISAGLPATLDIDVDSTAAALPVARLADSIETLVARALDGRADLAAARASFAAARERVKAARSARLPSLSIAGTGARTYTTTTLTAGAYNYTLGATLAVPLFNGFGREFGEAQARALQDAAAAAADSLQQRVIFEVFRSYYAIQTATRRVRTADDLRTSAEQSVAVALERYKQGVGTVLDLLVAQSALADARAQQVQARLSWNTALVQLSRDVGVLSPGGDVPFALVADSAASAP